MRIPFISTINREIRGMHQAAYILAAFAFGSQVLALVRDRLLAAQFGAGHTLDVYYAAFRIPDFLFATIASLLSLYALLPILSKLEETNEGSMVGFLRSCLAMFFVVMSVVCAVLYVFVPTIVPHLAPGVAGPDLVALVRILLLQPILLGASNIVAAYTQLRHRFVLYSISPLLYNVGIIVGIVYLYPILGIAGLGWGVVLGAALHLSVQLPFFATERVATTISYRQTLTSFKEVLLLSVPRTLALASNQITLMVLISLASYFASGSIAVFMFAFNLQAVPLTIIGVSYSVAAFPTLARLYARGDRAEFSRHIEAALRHIFLWSILAALFIIVLRAQLVRTILGAGMFDWTATRLVAAALALFIVSLFAQSSSLLIARAYYAAGQTLKPLLFGLCNVIVSLVASFGAIAWFQSSQFVQSFVESLMRVSAVSDTVVLMLALGYVIGSVVQFSVSVFFFSKDFAISLASIQRMVFQIFSAGVIGSFFSYATLAIIGSHIDIDTAIGVLTQGLIAGSIGLTMTLIVLRGLGNRELEEALMAIRRRVGTPRVALEPTDIES